MKRLDVQELTKVRDLIEGRELRERIDEILHMLEGHETIEVTENGKVIAHVVPIGQAKQSTERETSEAWKNLKRLSAELSTRWPEGINAVDAIRDVRQ